MSEILDRFKEDIEKIKKTKNLKSLYFLKKATEDILASPTRKAAVRRQYGGLYVNDLKKKAVKTQDPCKRREIISKIVYKLITALSDAELKDLYNYITENLD